MNLKLSNLLDVIKQSKNPNEVEDYLLLFEKNNDGVYYPIKEIKLDEKEKTIILKWWKK